MIARGTTLYTHCYLYTLTFAAMMDVFSFMDHRNVNLDEVFNSENKTRDTDLESLVRKLGYNIEKKVSLWWDTNTFDRYIREKIVPRRSRWELPLNDGLMDKESIYKWFHIFNDNSLEGLAFLLKRKQKKMRIIDQQIEEIKSKLDPYKESAEFNRLASQLNKDLVARDLEVQQRKMKKFQRDVADYKTDQVFKWQTKVENPLPASTYSTPEREVRIQQSGINPPLLDQQSWDNR